MRKQNGFVFMETIVVVSVLTITLLILFTSYSTILRKAKERNTYDTIDTVYKTYYVKDALEAKTTLKNYFNGSECKVVYSGGTAKVCDLSSNTYSGILVQLKKTLEIEKVLYIVPSQVLANDNYLYAFDATTIDYINKLGKSVTEGLLVVKYKKYYDSGDYEIFHASMEVTL